MMTYASKGGLASWMLARFFGRQAHKTINRLLTFQKAPNYYHVYSIQYRGICEVSYVERLETATASQIV